MPDPINLPISQMPVDTSLDGSEVVPVVQSGNKRTTAGAIAGLAPGTNLTYDPATRLLSSSTGADVTLPLVNTTAAGLLPHTWLTGAEAAILPHIHGDLAGRQYAHVRNVSGVPLAAGTPVCVVGAVGDTAQLEVIAADAGDPAKMPAFAVLDAALDATGSGRDGHGVISGETVNQNTAAFALRAEVFVAVGGGLTATPPTSGYVQSVGSISRSHASTGSLAVAIGPSLGNAALRNVGTTAGTVAAGDAPAAAISTHVAASDPHTQYLAKIPAPATLTYAATVDLDMTALAGAYRTITLTGNIAFTTSNRSAGEMVTLRIICDSTQRTLTFPAGWRFINAARPTTIAASKVAVLSVMLFGTADTDAIAAYGVEP